MSANSPQSEAASRIPFNRPAVVGDEVAYMQEAIACGQISGDGVFTAKCQELLQRELGVPAVLLTTSCTHALELAALLLNIGPGDEVIIPAFTFVATVNAFVLRGARPVFIDIREDTLNLDERQLERLITPRTKAIVVMHYGGVACEMEAIMELAARFGIPVVEDNAHGLFARYRGRYLGTFGAFATQSFHETKNFSCGEGGALIINNPTFIERAEILRQKGTDRSRLLRGQVDKYTWVDIGSSYSPSDLLAAFLFAQLQQREQIQRKRRRIWDTYHEALRDWAAAHGTRQPIVPEHCEQPSHLYYLLLPSETARDRLIRHLRERGILGVFHYLPLHISRMGVAAGGRVGDCPRTEDLSARLVRLPFYNDLAEVDQARVISAIEQFVV
jgi:dTDP-4-amino-4,6-dideoxygalactose transaminase